MARMKDIADRLGVSITTVSHVLRGRGEEFRIAARTAERVRDAARRMGYRASPLSHAFRHQRTSLIALAVGDLTDPFWTGVARGAQREAEKNGYLLVVVDTGERPEKEQLAIDLLRDRRVDGAILSPVHVRDRQLAQLQKARMPFVLADRYVEGLDVPSVYTDSAAGTRLVVDHLVGRGHRRIAYLGGPAHIATFRDRQEGFKKALARRGLKPVALAVCEVSHEGAQKAVRKLLDAGAAFTALFAANQWLTIGALRSLPPETEIAGFDELALADLLRKPVTTVIQPADDIGRWAVRLLLDTMAGKQARRRVVLPPRLAVQPPKGGNCA